MQKSQAGRLRAAAVMVDEVVSELNLSTRDCPECGHGTFVNEVEARLYERLNEIPKRLRNAAETLAK